MPDSLSLQFVNGPTEFATFDVSGWSPLTWTEVRVPFTYSSATTSLSDSISIVSPSGTFQQIGGSGGTQPFLFDTNTRIFQMDYGVIPEPSTSALLVSISMMAMLRRSRR